MRKRRRNYGGDGENGASCSDGGDDVADGDSDEIMGSGSYDKRVAVVMVIMGIMMVIKIIMVKKERGKEKEKK